MKKILFVLSILALSLGSAAAQSADETAIRTVIENESKAFHTNTDRTAFLGYWSVTPDTRLVYSGPADAHSTIPGDAMKSAAASGQLPPADNAVSEMTNFVIKASGTVGWAAFDQKTTTPDGKSEYMREIRCMEKVRGEWKIVSSSVHQYMPK